MHFFELFFMLPAVLNQLQILLKQHNAGTSFYSAVKSFVPCATRCCYQTSKHCMVSYNEQTEADNIRNNYEKHGVQYVSYELMLPPRFSLPFVSEEARQGLYFTTIVRDPFKRFMTHLRRSKPNSSEMHLPKSPFWMELSGRQNLYSGDNLNVRWLAGARDAITSDHVNIAKCRLQLFDLVIADYLYDHAVKRVLCPMNGWKGKKHCDEKIANEHTSGGKSDPLTGADAHLVGAWVERLRPSFEVYDYARILSLKQLKERGVTDLPEVSEVPSYLATLSKYTGMKVTDHHLNMIQRVSLDNEHLFSPPVEFCEQMKNVWANNAPRVPEVYGIGTFKQSFG